MGIPLEEYAEASFEVVTIHALPMMTVAASETMLGRDMTIFLPVQAPAVIGSALSQKLPIIPNGFTGLWMPEIAGH